MAGPGLHRIILLIFLLFASAAVSFGLLFARMTLIRTDKPILESALCCSRPQETSLRKQGGCFNEIN